MKIDGKKVRERRKLKGMSQNELAEGICKQATISNIERKNYCKNINILSDICAKLDLSLEHVLIDTFSNQMKDLLKEVEMLCSVGKHMEAYDLLANQSDSNIQLLENQSYAKFYYYKGITMLLGNEDIEQSILSFQKVIKRDESELIYKILATNSIGIAFAMKGDNILAEDYYLESVKMISFFEDIPLRLNRVYYNSAKFFSSQKKYNEAIELANKGIDINKRYRSMDVLDFLLYEKAFNKSMLSSVKEIEDYEFAKVIAKLNDNSHLLSVIQSDLGRIE